MAIGPTCPECHARMVAAEAVAGAGAPVAFQRNGWLWDASVLLCTKCGSVRLRAANMRQGGAGAVPEGEVAAAKR